MTEPYEQPKPKKKFWNKDGRKIAFIINILVNILSIVGVAGLCIAHILAPPVFLLSLPAFITLVFQAILKYAPNKLPQIKDMLLKALSKEQDKTVVESTYNEVLSSYEQNSGRHPALPSARSDKSDVTQRIPCAFVYNTKTKEYEAVQE
jgi:hypothetical protein